MLFANNAANSYLICIPSSVVKLRSRDFYWLQYIQGITKKIEISGMLFRSVGDGSLAFKLIISSLGIVEFWVLPY